MATLIIRNFDDKLKATLRTRAARNGHSMEAELRDILRVALAGESGSATGLGSAIRRRFAELGGVELELPKRDDSPRAATFT